MPVKETVNGNLALPFQLFINYYVSDYIVPVDSEEICQKYWKHWDEQWDVFWYDSVIKNVESYVAEIGGYIEGDHESFESCQPLIKEEKVFGEIVPFVKAYDQHRYDIDDEEGRRDILQYREHCN